MGNADDEDAASDEGPDLFKYGGGLLLLWLAYTWWGVIDADHWAHRKLQATGKAADGWVVDRGEHTSSKAHYYTLAATIEGEVRTRRWAHNLLEVEGPAGCLREIPDDNVRRLHPAPSTTPEQRSLDAKKRCSSGFADYEPFEVKVIYMPTAPDEFMPAEGPHDILGHVLAAALPTAVLLGMIWVLVGMRREDGKD